MHGPECTDINMRYSAFGRPLITLGGGGGRVVSQGYARLGKGGNNGQKMMCLRGVQLKSQIVSKGVWAETNCVLG